MPYDSEITTKSRDLIVLEKARERIARGWHRGALRRGDNYCLVGALLGVDKDVHNFIDIPDAEYWRANELVKLIGFGGVPEAWPWNDNIDRTQAEVLARFDAAIAKLSADTLNHVVRRRTWKHVA